MGVPPVPDGYQEKAADVLVGATLIMMGTSGTLSVVAGVWLEGAETPAWFVATTVTE